MLSLLAILEICYVDITPQLQSRVFEHKHVLIYLLQNIEVETILSRVEDAVLLLQGNPYMLAEEGALLQARRRRSPPSARVCTGLSLFDSVQYCSVFSVYFSCMFLPCAPECACAEPSPELRTQEIISGMWVYEHIWASPGAG